MADTQRTTGLFVRRSAMSATPLQSSSPWQICQGGDEPPFSRGGNTIIFLVSSFSRAYLPARPFLLPRYTTYTDGGEAVSDNQKLVILVAIFSGLIVFTFVYIWFSIKRAKGIVRRRRVRMKNPLKSAPDAIESANTSEDDDANEADDVDEDGDTSEETHEPGLLGAVFGIMQARSAGLETYRALKRSPTELRLEIKKIDRELERRRTADADESGDAHLKRFFGGVTSGHELTFFTREELHQLRDLFEEQLAVAPALQAAPTEKSETEIEAELVQKYEEEFAHGFRERVALDKARDNLKARYPSHADLIDRLHRKKKDKFEDPDL
jgi:hypothetical protein